MGLDSDDDDFCCFWKLVEVFWKTFIGLFETRGRGDFAVVVVVTMPFKLACLSVDTSLSWSCL